MAAMTQPTLFGQDQGPYERSTPLAANADPATSHEAAARHKSSGKLGSHERIALDLVRQHPGKTRWELWNLATDAERAELGDSVELMRRLGGLLGTSLKHGPQRVCRVKGTRAVTWEIA
jgi:hypothetical protein